jgi:hypothetical protein
VVGGECFTELISEEFKCYAYKIVYLLHRKLRHGFLNKYTLVI